MWAWKRRRCGSERPAAFRLPESNDRFSADYQALDNVLIHGAKYDLYRVEVRTWKRANLSDMNPISLRSLIC